MLDGVKQTLLIIKMRKCEARLKELHQIFYDFDIDPEAHHAPDSDAEKFINEYRTIQKEYLAVVKESKELRAK